MRTLPIVAGDSSQEDFVDDHVCVGPGRVENLPINAVVVTYHLHPIIDHFTIALLSVGVRAPIWKAVAG